MIGLLYYHSKYPMTIDITKYTIEYTICNYYHSKYSHDYRYYYILLLIYHRCIYIINIP